MVTLGTIRFMILMLPATEGVTYKSPFVEDTAETRITTDMGQWMGRRDFCFITLRKKR